MIGSGVIQLLVGIYCLNESLHPRVWASIKNSGAQRKPESTLHWPARLLPSHHHEVIAYTYDCWDCAFKKGSLIQAWKDPLNPEKKFYCGNQRGYYLAVDDKQLLRFQCDPMVTTETTAVPTITNVTDKDALRSLFDEEELCKMTPQFITTGDNAMILAKSLEGATVPYHHTACNDKIYTEYLAKGKVDRAVPFGLHHLCPVFHEFNEFTDVHRSVFNLVDMHNKKYIWLEDTKKKILYRPPTLQISSPFSDSDRNSSASKRWWKAISFARRKLDRNASNVSTSSIVSQSSQWLQKMLGSSKKIDGFLGGLSQLSSRRRSGSGSRAIGRSGSGRSGSERSDSGRNGSGRSGSERGGSGRDGNGKSNSEKGLRSMVSTITVSTNSFSKFLLTP